ncbi:MAG TPA: ABC transporter ATP-binding protein, partial [Casimicrobiaceae bacterium]|nr:ABC transporter ATP-binding protein [Casimicrobiaceae bacterium]
MSAEGPPRGANSAPAGGSAAAKPQAWGDHPKASAAERVTHPERRSLRERMSGMRNIPPFLALVWQTSPSMMLGEAVLRVVRALLPVVTLYVGKLIIDEVVLLTKTPPPGDELRAWLESGALDRIVSLLALEFGLAVLSDVLGRAASLLGQLFGQAQDIVTIVS